MNDLSKKLCNSLSTRWKTFTILHDVLIRFSKYSQIYQTPKFICTTTVNCPTSLSSVHTLTLYLVRLITSSHLQCCPLFSLQTLSLMRFVQTIKLQIKYEQYNSCTLITRARMKILKLRTCICANMCFHTNTQLHENSNQ